MAKSKKVNKWEAAPESIRKLKELIDKQRLSISLGECEDLIGLDALEKVLNEYNKLEAKHNADCGLISKLEEEVKSYETLTAGLHNDADELERTINNLEKMVEFHKGEVKELVKTADRVRDKHENDVCMLKKDIHDLEVKVKYYKEDNDDLECEVSKYKALYEGLQLTVDSVTRERNHFEYTLNQLIEQLKIKNDVYVDINECIDGNYKVENKRAADLQEDLDTLISERDNLKSKNRSWQVSYNAVEEKAKEATAVINGLNDYAKALKGRIQELEDRSKDIYNLATIGWINNSMYGYEEIRKMLSFDPKE